LELEDIESSQATQEQVVKAIEIVLEGYNKFKFKSKDLKLIEKRKEI